MPKKKKKSKKKLNWVQRLGRRVKRYMSGEAEKERAKKQVASEYAAYRKKLEAGKGSQAAPAKKKKKQFDTARTKQIIGRLGKSGMSEKDIKKLRGK